MITNRSKKIHEIGGNSIEKHSNGRRIVIEKMALVNLTMKRSPRSGYGHCRSCECKGYISKHDGSHECKNCNHHFDRHN